MIKIFDENDKLITLNAVVYEHALELPGNSGFMYFENLKDYYYPPILFVRIINGMIIPITFDYSKRLDRVSVKLKEEEKLSKLITLIGSKKKISEKIRAQVKQEIAKIKNFDVF